MHGPIDYLIVGFEGNKFDGSILRSIGEAIDNGVIALVALVVVSKDVDGVLTVVDIKESGDQYTLDFIQQYPGDSSLVDEDDFDELADLIENNTAAGMLVIEHIWAKPLKQALMDAGGVLVADGRIHPDAAIEIDKEEEE